MYCLPGPPMKMRPNTNLDWLSPSSTACSDKGLVWASFWQMVHIHLSSAQYLFSFIGEGLNLGPGPRVGGLVRVPSLDAVELRCVMIKV